MSGVKIQAISRAFSILEYIGQAGSAGVSEIARKLRLNKSTVFGMIKTLEAEGYLQQNTDNESYQLSLKFYGLANKAMSRLQIRDYAKPFLKQLSEKYGETVHLVVAAENEGIYIDKIESNKSVRIYTRIGDRLPLHCTGVGKSILAFRSDEKQLLYIHSVGLEKFTENTITDPERLLEELAAVRRNGYSVENGERLEEIFCVAVPILNHKGLPVYAVSISMPSYRATEEVIKQMVHSLKQLQKELENTPYIG